MLSDSHDNFLPHMEDPRLDDRFLKLTREQNMCERITGSLGYSGKTTAPSARLWSTDSMTDVTTWRPTFSGLFSHWRKTRMNGRCNAYTISKAIPVSNCLVGGLMLTEQFTTSIHGAYRSNFHHAAVQTHVNLRCWTGQLLPG